MKPAWKSKTVIGGVIAVVSGLLGIETDFATIEHQAEAILSITGGLLAIYGRLKAKEKVGL